MVLPPLDFESSASAISPPRLQVSTGKIIARIGLIKKNLTQAQSGKGTQAQSRKAYSVFRWYFLLCAFGALCLWGSVPLCLSENPSIKQAFRLPA